MGAKNPMHVPPVLTAQEGHFADIINDLAAFIHRDEKPKWWTDLHTGQPINRNVGEALMLTVGELAEALEAYRKNLNDDHLTYRRGIEVEFADAIIRLLDLGEGLGLDVGSAIMEKIAYNRVREDHQRESRLAAHGKKF